MSKPQSHCLAKALYDNSAESPDEIGFKRGDVLTVLEQNTNGLDGWWLCTLRGKQGIAPGNRLQLLAGMFAEPTPVNGHQVAPKMQQYDTKDRWIRRSWDKQTDKVITPCKMGDVYIYNQNNGGEDYDVPPSRYFPSDIYDSPQRLNNNKLQLEDVYDTPPSSRGRSPEVVTRVTPAERDSGVGETQDIYDVPPAQLMIVNAEQEHILPSNRSSTVSMLSSGSNVTMSSTVSSMSVPGSSNPPSVCGSARSSSELHPQDIYDVPASCRAVVKEQDIYDSPPVLSKSRVSSDYVDDYDTPKSYSKVVETEKYNSLPTKWDGIRGDIYDSPQNSSLLTISPNKQRLSPSPERDNECVYDVPPMVSRDTDPIPDSRVYLDNADSKRLSSSSNDSRGSDILCTFEELPMNLDSAMDLLLHLQQDVQMATNRLLSHVTATWRKRENLEPRLADIRQACMGVKTALQEYVDFAQGALANSTKAADKSLFHKLSKQLQPLQECLQTISKNMMLLGSWNLNALVDVTGESSEDYLGKIVNAVRLLSDSNRKLTSLIQGNGSLLFKRSTLNRSSAQDRPLPSPPGGNKPTLKPKPNLNTSNMSTPDKSFAMQDRPLPTPPSAQRPLPETPGSKTSTPNHRQLTSTPKGPKIERLTPERDGKPRRLKSDSSENILDGDETSDTDYANNQLFEEYDYVELQQKDIEEQKKYKREFDRKLLDEQNATLEKLEQGIKAPVRSDFTSVALSDRPTVLEANDKQLLVFYSQQMEPHCATLSLAIDNFFSAIESNQPPKTFIANSKYVVLAAHKLVFIGDTLHRNVLHADVRQKIMHCANYLCDCLKVTVNATKTAALQYPAVVAVQEMVDQIVGVSHAANELKLVISQAAAL